MTVTPAFLRITAFVVFAGLPRLGEGWILVLLLLLPLTCETLLSQDERFAPILGCVALGAHAAARWTGPWLILALCWCAAGIAMAVLPIGGQSERRGLCWFLLSVLFALALSICCAACTGRNLFDALAVWAEGWVQAQERGRTILFSLYSGGLLRLQATQAELAMLKMGGVYLMTEHVASELLYALRELARQLARLLLPGAMTGYCVLSGVLCAAVPDMLRAAKTGWSDLPPFENWRMSRRMTLVVDGIWLSAIVCMLISAPTADTARQMMYAVFQLAYGIQGAAALWWLMRDRGWKSPAVGAAAIMAACLLASMLLVLLGIVDQMLDLRHLEKGRADGGADDEDDDEWL